MVLWTSTLFGVSAYPFELTTLSRKRATRADARYQGSFSHYQ